MKTLRLLLIAALCAAALPALADEDAAFGHALTLVQMFVRAASQSSDPAAGLKALDDVLAGRNTEANRAFAGLLEEATAGLPAQHKDQVAAIGRDLASLARREAGQPSVPSTDRALQARKDLTAMGLRYYDEKQFQDAVKRRDKLAVDLFVAGQGIDPAVVSRSLPAER